MFSSMINFICLFGCVASTPVGGCTLSEVYKWHGRVKHFFKSPTEHVHVVVTNRSTNHDDYFMFDIRETVQVFNDFETIDSIAVDSQGELFVIGRLAFGLTSFYRMKEGSSMIVPARNINQLDFNNAKLIQNTDIILLLTSTDVYATSRMSNLDIVRDLSPRIKHYAVDSAQNMFLSQDGGDMAVLTRTALESNEPTVRFVNGVGNVNAISVGLNNEVFIGTDSGLKMLRGLEYVTKYDIGQVKGIVINAAGQPFIYTQTSAFYLNNGAFSQVKGFAGSATFAKVAPLAHDTRLVFTDNESSVHLGLYALEHTYSGWPNGQAIRDVFPDKQAGAFVLADDLFYVKGYAPAQRINLPNGDKKGLQGNNTIYLATYSNLLECKQNSVK